MILFRAEAGPAIGAGHAMRCLAVAEAVRDLGGETALALDAAAQASVPGLARGRVALTGPEPRACEVAVLDGYGFTEADERAWGEAGARIAVLEDAPGRVHACELLIDSAPGRRAAEYEASAPGAQLLLGSAFAPLGPAFAEARPAALARRASPGPLRRVLVSAGLMDAGGISAKALWALRAFPAIETIDLAVGAAAPSLPALRAAAAKDPRVRLHLDARDMAALTAAADLGIGAAGTSSWERCALGLPSLVVIAAANQAHNAAVLARARAALIVGEAADLTPESIAGSIAALEPPEVRAGMAEAAAALVDAGGARRIAEALLALARRPISRSVPRPAGP